MVNSNQDIINQHNKKNYYKNSDIITDFNEAYFDHIILQDHRRAKYKEKID
jgi:hypothetical protein